VASSGTPHNGLRLQPADFLDRLGYLPALRELHGGIVIPQAVARELGSRPGMPASIAPNLEWVETREARTELLQRVHEGPPSVDSGEAEAIALALGERATVVVDDLPGRVRARRLGVNLTGTIGEVLALHRVGLTSLYSRRTIEEDLHVLRLAGMHISEDLLLRVLGEIRHND